MTQAGSSITNDKAEFLVNEQLKAISTRCSAGDLQMKSCLKLIISGQRQTDLMVAIRNYELIERHTSYEAPRESGIYLLLIHGRSPYDQELEDWGSDGPWIGPIKWFHCTYLKTFSLGFMNGDEYLATAPVNGIPAPIYFFEDMIYFDGIYYGDWELQAI